MAAVVQRGPAQREGDKRLTQSTNPSVVAGRRGQGKSATATVKALIAMRRQQGYTDHEIRSEIERLMEGFFGPSETGVGT